MNDYKYIRSLQNPLVKRLLLLREKSRERKKTGSFLLEGQRELQLALKGNYSLRQLFFNRKIIPEDQVIQLIGSTATHPELIELAPEVYQKLAYRQTTEGVLAEVSSKSHDLSSLALNKKKPLVLVAEAPEKDLYNPNIIRSSVGCIFTNQIAMGNTAEVISFLNEHNINIYCAALSASETYTAVDYRSPAAIVVGTEATGLSSQWLAAAKKNIIIPMEGEIDSLNVSVSAAILIFEAKRQRKMQ